MVSPSKFVRTHLFIPLFALFVVSAVMAIGSVDRSLADYFYSLQGNSWAWKDSWIAEEFFHKGGRTISIFLALMLFAFLALSHFHSSLSPHKKSLVYFFMATAGGSFLVSVLKSALAVSCPWEFERYGGDLFYSGVIEQLFLRNGEGCFPAGHASAGYAWVSAYFFGLYYQSKWRWLGLAIPLIAGMVLGLVQQIRGAHFISHDVWSVAVCWFFSFGLFYLFFKSPSAKLAAPDLLCR
ncbi:MAG TPA: PAP2 family protein [Cellvibrio sp.]|nr:PAP2 family protein [Cellvibrio sp.]